MFYYRAYQLNIQSDIPLGKIEQTSYCVPDVIIRKTSEIPDIPTNASRLGNKYASLKISYGLPITNGAFILKREVQFYTRLNPSS